MTEERIVELRALCAEYKRKLAACESAGLKDKAADIAADGVGRRALEALPELLAELESLREKVYGAYHLGIKKRKSAGKRFRECRPAESTARREGEVLDAGTKNTIHCTMPS